MGKDATASSLAYALLGRPVLGNFKALKQAVIDKIDSVTSGVKESASNTRDGILNLPNTVAAGLEMQVEDAKSQARQSISRTIEGIKAAPKQGVDGAAKAVTQTVFDLKEAVARTATAKAMELRALPGRVVDDMQTGAQRAVDEAVRDVQSAPAVLKDSIARDVERRADGIKAKLGIKGSRDDDRKGPSE